MTTSSQTERRTVDQTSQAGSTPTAVANRNLLQSADQFVHRHLGPRSQEISAMLQTLGLDSIDALIDQAIPANIRLPQPLNLDPVRSETAVLQELQALAQQN